jgi:alkanesulfonate monooxygenase SsuD/methylene tetrahydromethanopterin reductase-like flavin-dependent oxidoreductase (luciferase family)
MIQDLRFGVITVQSSAWDEMVRRWKSVETLGFDSVWLADHFVDPFDPQSSWFECWTLLAALATHTSHIRTGTLVTSVPLRNPAVLARQTLTVDHISKGRLELGLGTGISGKEDPSYAMTSIDDWPISERVGRFREQVEIIDQLLRNRVSSYHGRYYQLRDAAMVPAPIQQPRPPITIAAMSSSMLKIAARHADTWNSVEASPDATPEVVVEKTRMRAALLDRYCAEIGRDPKTIRRSLLVFWPEAETVFESEENFREIVKRYVGIGITELIFYYPSFRSDQMPTFERIAKQVIPEMRATRVHC